MESRQRGIFVFLKSLVLLLTELGKRFWYQMKALDAGNTLSLTKMLRLL